MNTLHITNGDCAVDLMQEAGVVGDILPWRDVLHEGPVPADLELVELSEVRARFIAERGWASFDEALSQFQERDNKFSRFCEYAHVILWFEHDLYDQLQLIQILDWLGEQDRKDTCVSMICTDKYLGWHTVEELKQLIGTEKPVISEQFDVATQAWSAFRAVTPEKWYGLLKQDLSSLPFLSDAVLRQLQELPAFNNGLSRTENQILSAIDAGNHAPFDIFNFSQSEEKAVFMGDSSFWFYLAGLLEGTQPLLSLANGQRWAWPVDNSLEFSLTQTGMDVLHNKLHRLDDYELDRWIGGVRLTADNMWYWQESTQTVINK